MDVLAGDIGGTNTRLAKFQIEEGATPILEKQVTLESAALDSLEEAIDAAFHEERGKFSAAVIAVAGPVVGGKSTLTNLPWTLSEQSIRDHTGIDQVELINDQVGLAHFVPHAGLADRVVLNEGVAVSNANLAVIAPGTGLGEAFLTPSPGGYLPQATEGGHTDFAPVNTRQIRLLEFMLTRHKRVSYERVCSGMAIYSLYQFLRDSEGFLEPEWLSTRVNSAADPGAAIFELLHETPPGAELCLEVARLFVELLAQEAGNLVLKTLALGGLFLGGGIPPRLLPQLESGFMARFVEKGRMSPLLQATPVSVIVHPQPTLWGAAIRAAMLAGITHE